mgnify:FL=1
MPSNYFSANPKGSGAALFVSFQSKEQCVFFKLLKQVSWDAKSRTGSFKDGAFVNVKFSPDEVADFIRAVRVNGESKFYHQFINNVTSGWFRYYHFDAENNNPAKSGFGLTVKNGDTEFKVGFTLGSAERLAEYLKFALQRINEAIYAADKKDAEEYAAKKKQETKTPPQTTNPKPEPTNTNQDGAAEGDLF